MRLRFRIARGSVEDVLVSRRHSSPVFREGWWWVCDGIGADGQPYDPEGPFRSKQAASRHLHATLSGRDLRSAWGCFVDDDRYLRRPSMRTVMKIRTTAAMRRAAIRAGRE